MSKRFMHISIAILCLALAYHFGASSATGQAPANPIVASYAGAGCAHLIAVTANGDLHFTNDCGLTWHVRGNVFGGGPIPVEQESWGKVKARYR